MATKDTDQRISIEKRILMNLLSMLVGVACVIFATYYYIVSDLFFAITFTCMSLGVLINFLIFKRKDNQESAFFYFAFVGIPALLPWQLNGGIGGVGIYYHFLYIAFLFFLLGKVKGLLMVVIMLFLSVLEFLLQRLGYLPIFYSIPTMITFYFGYLLQTALLYIYQISKDKAQAELKQQSEILSQQSNILKTQKANLEESNAKNDAVLESVGDGLVAFDISGNVMLTNESVHKLLGWRKEELFGKKWSEIVALVDQDGKTVAESKRPFITALSKEEKVSTGYKYSYRKKDQSLLPVSITISPIVLSDKIVGAIEVFRDVTKEKEVDRMKTEFISLTSHQLRTPLSAMKWNLEMLLAGDAGKLNDEQHHLTQKVDKSNERMIGLVNSLLNVSRIESGRIIIEPEMTDIAELVSGVVQEVQQTITEKKQQLIVSINKGLPKIKVDQQLIRQVYLNLLTNAIKYTPAGGEITIIVSANEKEIISQISDTGYGIPAKDKDKVFEKFYRGENITKIITDGNGLGMYLAKAIITSSHGKIWFQSHMPDEKGLASGKQGTTFWFSLPKSGMKAKKGEVTLDA